MPKTVTYDEKIAALKITTAALKNAAKCVLCLRYYHINSADFVRHEFEVDDEIVERGQLVLYLADLNLTGFGSENPARVIVSGKCVAELLIFDSQGNKSSAQTEFMLSQQEAIKLRKLYERRKAAEPARPEPTAGSPSSEPQGDPAATATIPQPEAAKKVPAPHAPLLMMEAVENEIKRKSFEATSIKIKIRESQEVLNSLANDAADRKAEYEKTIAGLKQSFADESQKRLKELSDAFSAETKKVYDECNRRTEHALTELEQRCKQLPQESAPAPVIIADQSGEIERQLAVLRTKAAEVEALKETFRSGVGDAADKKLEYEKTVSNLEDRWQSFLQTVKKSNAAMIQPHLDAIKGFEETLRTQIPRFGEGQLKIEEALASLAKEKKAKLEEVEAVKAEVSTLVRSLGSTLEEFKGNVSQKDIVIGGLLSRAQSLAEESEKRYQEATARSKEAESLKQAYASQNARASEAITEHDNAATAFNERLMTILGVLQGTVKTVKTEIVALETAKEQLTSKIEAQTQALAASIAEVEGKKSCCDQVISDLQAKLLTTTSKAERSNQATNDAQQKITQEFEKTMANMVLTSQGKLDALIAELSEKNKACLAELSEKDRARVVEFLESHEKLFLEISERSKGNSMLFEETIHNLQKQSNAFIHKLLEEVSVTKRTVAESMAKEMGQIVFLQTEYLVLRNKLIQDQAAFEQACAQIEQTRVASEELVSKLKAERAEQSRLAAEQLAEQKRLGEEELRRQAAEHAGLKEKMERDARSITNAATEAAANIAASGRSNAPFTPPPIAPPPIAPPIAPQPRPPVPPIGTRTATTEYTTWNPRYTYALLRIAAIVMILIILGSFALFLGVKSIHYASGLFVPKSSVQIEVVETRDVRTPTPAPATPAPMTPGIVVAKNPPIAQAVYWEHVDQRTTEPRSGIIPLSENWSQTIYLQPLSDRSAIEWNVVEANVPVEVLVNNDTIYLMDPRSSPGFKSLHIDDGSLMSIAWSVPPGYDGSIRYSLY